MGLFNHRRYIELAMHFRCNLRCTHCMIETTMHHLDPQDDAQLQAVLDHNREHRQWDGLILTGAEITLRRDLPEIARRASAHGFLHVRLQTHGMRLADPAYCRELIDSGIDEFFISITAADPETHDTITGVPGSFEKALRGLENLEAFDHVSSMTNTVITAQSYRDLPAVVDRLAHLRRLVQMDFWGYWPMTETDDKNLLVPYSESVPYLRDAIARARRLGRAVEVKNVPECLLGPDAPALENDQPQLLIDPDFWTQFRRNGFHQCALKAACQSRRCLGIPTAYANRFGWLHDPLVPLGSSPSHTPLAFQEARHA